MRGNRGPWFVEERREQAKDCAADCSHECDVFFAVVNMAGDVIAEVFNEADAHEIAVNARAYKAIGTTGVPPLVEALSDADVHLWYQFGYEYPGRLFVQRAIEIAGDAARP